MIEKKEYKTWDNQLLLTQIKQDLYALPELRKPFYCDLLAKPALITNTLFLSELFALINYELVLNEFYTLNSYLISKEELWSILPWVSEECQTRWEKTITTYHPFYVLETLQTCATDFLKRRQEVIHEKFVEKIKTKEQYEEIMPDLVTECRNIHLSSFSVTKSSNEYLIQLKYDAYSKGSINDNEYIGALTGILKNMAGNLAYSFYEDLVLDRSTPEFKNLLISLLQMQCRMCLLNGSIEPTNEELDKYIALLEDGSRKEYETKKAELTPEGLHKALQAHLRQIREALIATFTIFQSDEKYLVIEFPKDSWRMAFVSLLAGADSFCAMYYQNKLNTFCFDIQKNNAGQMILELPTKSICNRFRRLLIDYPEKAIASVPNNKKAICLSNEKNGFFYLPIHKKIMETSMGEKADTERALRLLQLGFFIDDKCPFANLPKDIIGVIAVLICYFTESKPLSEDISYNFNRI